MTRLTRTAAVALTLLSVPFFATVASGQETPGGDAAPLSEEVFFKARSYRLDAQAKTVLDRVAVWLQNHPEITIWIEGYGDRRGNREHNLIMGEKRAGSVKSYLLGKGISSRRLSCISYGKEQAAARVSSPETLGKDRRVRLVVRDVF